LRSRSAGWSYDHGIGLDLTADDIQEWAPFHPLEIYWAKKNGLPLAEARRWARHGVPIRDTIKAREVGLSVAELHRWQAAGFSAADAWEAKETGVTIPVAIAWREAGFVLPDALQLVRDRWSLEDAIVARYQGIHPYGAMVGRPGS
jgi:hypothetical protein